MGQTIFILFNLRKYPIVTTVARNLSGPSGDPALAQSFDQEAAAVSLLKVLQSMEKR